MKNQLSISLKLYKDDELVLNTFSKSKMRVLNSAQRENFDKGYIKVTYAPTYDNQAEFTTIEQLKTLLSVFTESMLVKEFV